MQPHPHANGTQISDLAVRYHRQLMPIKKALSAKVIDNNLHTHTLKPAFCHIIAQKAGEVNLKMTWTPEISPGRMRELIRPSWAGDSTTKRTRHTPEQIIRKFKTDKQLISQGKTVGEVCRIIV